MRKTAVASVRDSRRLFGIAEYPDIPDFEILARIGGGAYGEVYLGRTVTGRLRAVKVVRREDFERERTFEREFEGIQHYERVSHEHPALVDVLHVGRAGDGSFYYYVMELADDEGDGDAQEDPASYRARTLASDLRQSPVRSVAECVDLGIRIAGALAHLHAAGLTHRDVKPSNIIFVNGQAKLADVGLVARSGQRTYVGTEGYVPPEGPGTAAADLYSLAMVLYEMHTGKDRFDFPELPTNLEIPRTVNRDEWRSLNSVICRGGAPDPRKRYESGRAFAAALHRVRAPETAPPQGGGGLAKLAWIAAVLALLGAFGGVGFWLWQDREIFLAENRGPTGEGPLDGNAFVTKGKANTPPPEKGKAGEAPPGSGSGENGETPGENSGAEAHSAEKGKTGEAGAKGAAGSGDPDPGSDPATKPGEKDDPGGAKGDSPREGKSEPEAKAKGPPLIARPTTEPALFKLFSSPGGATVAVEGEPLGRTPTQFLELAPGLTELVVSLPGYHDYRLKLELPPGRSQEHVQLLPDFSPVEGMPWTNSEGIRFRPEGGSWISETPVSTGPLERYATEAERPVALVSKNGAAQVADDELRWAFCDWLTERDRQLGFLDDEHYLVPVRDPTPGREDELYLALDDRFGALIVNTEPEGARVFRDGRPIGETPLVLDRVRFGPLVLEMRAGGYAAQEVTGIIESTEARPLVVELERNKSVAFGAPWTNSLGMPLVPAAGLMVAVYETRVDDFRIFLEEAGGTVPPPAPGFPQGPDHPVAGVSWSDAAAFCDWLTRRERRLQLIEATQRYRLPTDREWSLLAGLEEEAGASPRERDGLVEGRFPWGGEWPPPFRAGNFADSGSAQVLGRFVIGGYRDGFIRTAPVGSYDPSFDGIHDLAGNVWEWVADAYDEGGSPLGVLRGGGWNSYQKEVLHSAFRNAVPSETREDTNGFRFVLVNEKATER